MRFAFACLNLVLTALLTGAILCALAQPAYAYVDPGSGLFAFQIISTSFAGMVFILRRRLRSLFSSMMQRMGQRNQKAAKS
jgi:hypothetical protein